MATTSGLTSGGRFEIANVNRGGKPFSELRITFENGMTSTETCGKGPHAVEKSELYTALIAFSPKQDRMEMRVDITGVPFVFVKQGNGE
jgi:hypothetical protein